MPRLVRIILVGLCYLVFGVFGFLMAYVRLPIALLGVREGDRRVAKAQGVLHAWSRRYFGFMRLLGVLRVHLPPPEQLATLLGPRVVVCNHPSLLDVVFIMGAVPRITYVAKEEWVRGFLVGPMLRACGHIGVPRGTTPADGAIALERMMETLQAGRNLLVFPEGSRSPRKGLLPFRRGAFEAAARVGVPVVPVILEVDPPMLRKNQPWFDVADCVVDFRMRVMPTINADGRSSRTVARDVEDMYRRELNLTETAASEAVVPTEAQA